MLKSNNIDCFVWEGGNLPLLSIKNGDVLSTIFKPIIDVLCEQEKNITDLKSLDFACLDNTCICEDEVKLKEVIQLLLKNDCIIKQTIQNKIDSVDNSENLLTSLDLGCLLQDYIDSFVTDLQKCDLDIDINKITQLLIDTLCKYVFQYQWYDTQYQSIRQQLDTFLDSYSVYSEPVINSCLNSGAILSNHVINITDQSICEYKNILGDSIDLTTVGCRDCISEIKKLNTHYIYNDCLSGVSPIICKVKSIIVNGITYVNTNSILLSSLSSLVQNLNSLLTFYNLQGNFIINNNDILLLDNNFSVSIIIDDCINSEEVEIDFILVSVNNTNTLFNNLIYLNHIICIAKTLVKETIDECCSVDCNDIKIKIVSDYNIEEGILTLSFKNSDIPNGTISNDSILTITDSENNFIEQTVLITKENNVEISLADLNISGELFINIKAIFTIGTTVCKQCVSDSITISDISDCQNCKICAEGEEKDYITILYIQDGVDYATKLVPGQCFSINSKDNITIKSVTKSSDTASINYDLETCEFLSLPDVINDTCWEFILPDARAFGGLLLKGDCSTFGQDTTEVELINASQYIQDFLYLETNFGLSGINGKIYNVQEKNIISTTITNTLYGYNLLPNIPLNTPQNINCIYTEGSIDHVQDIFLNMNVIPNKFDPCSGGASNQALIALDSIVTNVPKLVIKVPGQVTPPKLHIKDNVTGSVMCIVGALTECTNC